MPQNNPTNTHHWNLEHSYAHLAQELFSEVLPSKVTNPCLAIFNFELAHQLGLHFTENDTLAIEEIFSGNQIPFESKPIAQAYGGHQFGHFNILGDGRAILLGEQITPDNKRFDIQLKGSGLTPYSRRGDGKATLSAMLREYIISEAMHGLEIPTSRSLAVIKSGEKVMRDGMPEGAILTRVAQSHIRIGTFEYVSRDTSKNILQQFTNYTINRHYPELQSTENPVLSFFKMVLKLQVELIVNWMRVGFIHGVMNTDNTAISGETIDYGPCAFMNTYHPATVFSSIDTQGRYSFQNQPAIIHWNLSCLAGALVPVVDDNEEKSIVLLTDALNEFQGIFHDSWTNMMLSKIGILNKQESDIELLNELLLWMKAQKADYTNTFIYLQDLQIPNSEIYNQSEFLNWQQKWKNRIAQENKPFETMSKVNPVYIPRNHQVEKALLEASTNNDYSYFNKLLSVLKNPYYFNLQLTEYQQSASFEEDRAYYTYCGT